MWIEIENPNNAVGALRDLASSRETDHAGTDISRQDAKSRKDAELEIVMAIGRIAVVGKFSLIGERCALPERCAARRQHQRNHKE